MAEDALPGSVEVGLNGPSPDDGLGYSRHYAQRIRDLGETSKESWIKRLWNHMFGSSVGSTKDSCRDLRVKSAGEAHNDQCQPVISTAQMAVTSVNSQTAADIPTAVVAVNVVKEKEVRFSELVDATSLPSHNHDMQSQEQENSELKGMQLAGHGRVPLIHERTTKPLPTPLTNSPYLPSKEKVVIYKTSLSSKPPRDDGVTAARLRYEKLSKSSNSLGYASMPNIKLSLDSGNSIHNSQMPRIARDVATLQLERRAKTIADRAAKAYKVFTCNAPYPVDVFVRYNLRKRGWVEKFGPRVMSAVAHTETTDRTLQFISDKDYEELCNQTIPKPWEEDRGIYTIVSRCVQHCPPKFIWAGKSINSVVLKSDVIVNHFPKARYFSSKVMLTTSLKDLPWQNNSDPMTFFPRCYLLNDNDRADIIDDFQLTSCMSLLKLVLERHVEGRHSSHHAVPNDCPYADGNETSDGMLEMLDDDGATDHMVNNIQVATDVNSDGSGVTHHTDLGDHFPAEDDETNQCAADIVDDTDQDQQLLSKQNQQKVVPDLLSTIREKKGGTVPSKALDWAIQQCDQYIRSKNHEDIDKLSRKCLSRRQWDQLLAWFYQVSQDGATIEVSENKLRECESVLNQIRHMWPQYDIDGVHNIWIVKPGDKSKGIGISFCDNLDNVLKYINNPNTEDYIVQKYIERPLLIYKCKFDVRQWFLVTDWSPLTIWFYKDSYLRICSQEFSYDCMHESIHLSNVAVQENYINGKRSEKLPENNFMTSEQFKQYLSEIGADDVWENMIYPGMKEAVINTMIATQEVTDSRKNAFELYGADFMMSDDYKPWLLEVNSSPGMLPSSVEKAKLCAAVIGDTIKVVLDQRENSSSETGQFELVYHDSTNPNTRGHDTKFIVEGQRIKKLDLQRFTAIDQRAMRIQQDHESQAREKCEEAKKFKHETAPMSRLSENSEENFLTSAGAGILPSEAISTNQSHFTMNKEIVNCDDSSEDEVERFNREQLELIIVATSGAVPDRAKTRSTVTQNVPAHSRTNNDRSTVKSASGLRKSTIEIYGGHGRLGSTGGLVRAKSGSKTIGK
jgi:tubulin monoglycylase TTLL3/8